MKNDAIEKRVRVLHRLMTEAVQKGKGESKALFQIMDETSLSTGCFLTALCFLCQSPVAISFDMSPMTIGLSAFGGDKKQIHVTGNSFLEVIDRFVQQLNQQSQ